MKIIFATDLEGDSEEIIEKRQKFAGYLSAIHSMSHENIEIKRSTGCSYRDHYESQ